MNFVHLADIRVVESMLMCTDIWWFRINVTHCNINVTHCNICSVTHVFVFVVYTEV